jgi:ubiquinone/menaquinone biosynthesis C-methylase UbiE
MSSITEFVGSIPFNYDQYLGPLFFEPYALDIFERLKGKQYQRILELACGTGRVTRHLAELVKEQGQLYATDLNPDMLQMAKQKADDGQIHWQVVDAHDIPYDTGFFDVVVCQFGIMFFEDKSQALREIHRVLKPGGTFLFNTWDRVEYNAASCITQQVLNNIFTEDPPDFLEKGPYSLSDPQEIRSLLEKASFTQIEIAPVAKTGVLSSADQVAKGIVEGSPLTGYLQERQAPEEEIKKRITDAIATAHKNMQLPMQALVCTAKKNAGAPPVV